MFFRQQEGDDAGAAAGLEDPVLRFDAAEVGEKDTVEGEAVALRRLFDLDHPGRPAMAMLSRVVGEELFHRTRIPLK